MSDDNREENADQGPAWGWGWLSEAAQAAKDAFDSSVKPALISMENTTSQFGTLCYLPYIPLVAIVRLVGARNSRFELVEFC